MSRLIASGVLATVILIQGCAAGSKPYVAPLDVNLQDPLPGTAVIYVIRAPYDTSELSIYEGNRKLATLPSSTYTAITLQPGKHVLITHSPSIFFSELELAPKYELALQAEERKFLYISGENSTSPTLTALLPISGTIMPLILPTKDTSAGTRSWKEINELDAQGLMSIAKPVLPEKGAL